MNGAALWSAERGPALPSDAAPYRSIGPFALDTIPAGLFRLHRLKSGVWGMLAILEGSIRFVWDDDAAGTQLLHAPQRWLIPPEVPHHLEADGPVSLIITFYAIPA